MRSQFLPDAGAVTAEFAVVLPAAVLVLAALLGGLGIGEAQIRATDAAAIGARSLARGDSPGTASALVATAGAGAITAISLSDGLECVTVASQLPVFGLTVTLPVASRACALAAATG